MLATFANKQAAVRLDVPDAPMADDSTLHGLQLSSSARLPHPDSGRRLCPVPTGFVFGNS